MKIPILIISLFISLASSAQEIKSMKIDELEAYIKSRPGAAVVNFWATWCAPCIEEMPWFNKIVPEYRGVKNELIFVSLDSKSAYPEQIKNIINRQQLKATFIWLNETNADEFCPRIDPEWGGSIPATLFVNQKNGYRKFLEEQISPTELRKQLRSLNN
ncbi:MAG: redoxin domain-containing protein [Chitinophagaceae bacterium]|nr:redoxin domain-containing protein [Chitinophagaceae bacterium]